MKEYIKTIINGLKIYIKNSRGDWNQNDETAPNYIKNRTHWVEKNPEIILFEEYGVPKRLSNEQNPPYILSTPFFIPEVGQEYVIKINNDKIFYSIAYQEGNRIVLPLTDNGFNFGKIIGQQVYYRGEYSERTIDIIVTTLKEKVYKIDEKFLPKQNILNGESPGSVRTITTNTNIGIAAFAEGYKTTASGNNSHAEGYETTASGNSSHAEGEFTVASANGSHAEGYQTEASGNNSHAEGIFTEASGDFSHAEGAETIASGDFSHAEGEGTIASGYASHVQGQFNIEDIENKYAHIVGNGEYSDDGSLSSNAHTLDWDGNAWFQGDIYLGGTGQEDYVTKVVTEKTISQPRDHISFKDIENNFIYILQMKNGNLVSRRTISRIKITKMPNKLNYTEGEIFNPEGMEVVGYCEDGNIIVINNYTYPKTPIFSNIITISYEEAGKIYIENINISISPFNPEEVLIDFYYTTNEDGTYTITDWKGTYNGVSSTKIIVPDNGLIKI